MDALDPVATPTLAELRACGTHRAAIAELAGRLPDAVAFDALVAEAIRSRDERAFVPLVLAGLVAGRPLDARHLAAGGALFDDPLQLALACWRAQGDVAQALVDAVASERMGVEHEALALLLAVLWCGERAAEVPEALVAMARRRSRRLRNLDVAAILVAIGEELEDAELLAALGGWRSVLADAVTRLRERLRETAGPVLAQLDLAPAPVAQSGYTVRRAVERVGRNEPCPCGSGKKYKRCCFAADQERLRHSSAIGGVTVDELREHPEEHLTWTRLHELRSHELARLDAARVPVELRSRLVERLVIFGEHEQAIAVLEALGVDAELEDAWHEAVYSATQQRRTDLVERLFALHAPAGDDEQLSLATRLLLERDDPGAVLRRVEAAALEALRAETHLPLTELAHSLLVCPYPALGVLVARGALPITSDMEVDTLYDALLETRARLGLPSVRDPIEAAAFELREADAPRGQDDSAELALLRARSTEKASEAVELRRSVGELQARLTELERERAALVERAAAPAAPAPAPPPSTPSAAAGELSETRRKLAEVKAALKERHRERNELRRALADLRRDQAPTSSRAAARADGSAPTADGDDGDEGQAVELGAQPPRIPSFARRFREELAGAPERVARAALKLVGELAAGEPAAYRGALHLRRLHDVLRQRVGASHRLLFRLEDDALELLALVPRRDLERAIRSLS